MHAQKKGVALPVYGPLGLSPAIIYYWAGAKEWNSMSIWTARSVSSAVVDM